MKKILPFLAILAMVPFASAQDCPKDFIDQLNGDMLTKLQKVNIGKACQGITFTMEGAVLDVGPEQATREKSPIILSLNWGNPFDYSYNIFMAEQPGCDLAKLQKGEHITVTAKFKRYLGYNTRAEATDGTCRK